MSSYANAFTLKASKFTLTKRNGIKSSNAKDNKKLNNQSDFAKFKLQRPISKNNKPKKEFVTLNNDFISFFKKLDIIKKSTLTTNRTCTISSSVSHSKRKAKDSKQIKHKEIKITINSSSMNNSIKKKNNQYKPKKTFTTFNPFHIQFAKPANVKNKNNKTNQNINKKIPINNPKVNKTIDTNKNILYKQDKIINTTNDNQIDDELLEDNYISDIDNDDEGNENSGVLAYEEVKDIICYYDMKKYKTKFLFTEGDYSNYITNRKDLYIKFFGFKKENSGMKTASTNASSKTKNNYVSVIKTNK